MANTANSTMKMICNFFSDHSFIFVALLISGSNTTTFNLWWLLKEYKNERNLHTLEELKQNIQLCI